MKYTASTEDKSYEIEVEPDGKISINGQIHSVDFRGIEGEALCSLLMDNRSWEVLVERNGDEYRVLINGELHVITIEDERTRKVEKGLSKVGGPSGELTVKAPMPGLVRGVPVQVGQEIIAGQGLVILEAMKMENELRAPRGGTVKEVRVKPGDKVEHGQALVVIK